MQLVSFTNSNGDLRAGALVDGKVIDLSATDASLPPTLRALLAAGDDALKRAERVSKSPDAKVATTVRPRAPIPNPEKVICVGLNYRDHAAESGAKIPTEPVIFNKFPSAVRGPDDDILLPSASQEVDYEAELVVVIGRAGRNIQRASAIEHVAGYTAGHDVSARDWQLKKDGKQWLLGKSFDSFAPMGPVLVTRDEIPDPHDLAIQFRLNGQRMQNSNTSQMIFRIDELIAYVSRVCTLEPGDVIFTGTGSGVGFARTPPVFLKPGDVCEVEVAQIGVLRNVCRQAD